ncbi:hypothetical protein BJP27_00930 [Pseudomonas oryzihabitans]|nr:hypothetical protein BJP27_00930 [Pseudomonas psychrotolerans]
MDYMLLAVDISQKESDHRRKELAAARAMAIDEKMDADRLRSQISWLQGERLGGSYSADMSVSFCRLTMLAINSIPTADSMQIQQLIGIQIPFHQRCRILLLASLEFSPSHLHFYYHRNCIDPFARSFGST